MAHTYAGILGLLGFLTCLARGLLHGESALSTLSAACGAMLALAASGLVLGAIAGATVRQSVRQRVEAELAADGSGPAAGPAAT